MRKISLLWAAASFASGFLAGISMPHPLVSSPVFGFMVLCFFMSGRAGGIADALERGQKDGEK